MNEGSGRGDGALDWVAAQGWAVVDSGPTGRGGNGWSTTSVVRTDHGDLFVKRARRPAKDMFDGEAQGLSALRAAGGPSVPRVHHVGDDGSGGSFIVMDCVDLDGRLDMRQLGRAMARLHAAEPADPNAAAGLFGFAVDNSIGETPQLNSWTSDWPEFFRDYRMGFQVRRAGSPALTALWARVLSDTDGLRSLFSDGPVRPSLLHGDFWSGNFGAGPEGPVIYDPAAYYGHHEAEWGMAWCAGLTSKFWAGYREVIPESPLFERRRGLYEAYHQLNHYNLFGSGYMEETMRLLSQYVDP